jgi:hypothetical protein
VLWNRLGSGGADRSDGVRILRNGQRGARHGYSRASGTCHSISANETEELRRVVSRFRGDRKALLFGRQKLNPPHTDHAFEPRALNPTGGSGDLYSVAADKQTAIEADPIDRTGTLDMIRSIYIRDPDQNLIEISNYPLLAQSAWSLFEEK